MRTTFVLVLKLCFFLSSAQQNQIVELPFQAVPGVTWSGGEKAYHSKIWDTPVVTNVAVPTMEVFLPKGNTENRTAVIVAPGGGLYAHSITKEGSDVAQWLNKKGIVAFVLKYRLVPTGEDGVGEITALSQSNPNEIGIQVAKVLPFAIDDGLNAIAQVRKNAKNYGVDPNKIGFMGFSAGGAVTMGVAYNYGIANKPNFLVPVYPWTDVMPIQTPKEDAPPMFIVCATDDPLGLAKGSIALYSSMFEAGKPVALHMFAKGGHGFGAEAQGLPADKWLRNFYEWSVGQGITKIQ